jgi:hypothetical protein
MLPEVMDRILQSDGSASKAAQGVEMPWFPDFVSAVELAHRPARASVISRNPRRGDALRGVCWRPWVMP